MNNNKLDQELKEFEDREVLEQSIALVEIVKDLLAVTKHQLNKVYILLLVSILSNLIIVGAFLWYESHMSTEIETVTETTTTTQTVEGENSQITNISGNQYNDESVHNE